MDPTLTKQAAIEKAVGYLQKTLAAMPEGTELSLQPQNPKLADLGPTPDSVQQCSDSDAATPENTPSQVQIRYWVTGIPEGKDHEYFEKLLTAWKSLGFKLADAPEPHWASTVNADGYELVVTDANRGTGSLSIGAGTPCIEPKNLHGAKPMPHTIKHP